MSIQFGWPGQVTSYWYIRTGYFILIYLVIFTDMQNAVSIAAWHCTCFEFEVVSVISMFLTFVKTLSQLTLLSAREMCWVCTSVCQNLKISPCYFPTLTRLQWVHGYLLVCPFCLFIFLSTCPLTRGYLLFLFLVVRKGNILQFDLFNVIQSKWQNYVYEFIWIIYNE